MSDVDKNMGYELLLNKVISTGPLMSLSQTTLIMKILDQFAAANIEVIMED